MGLLYIKNWDIRSKRANIQPTVLLPFDLTKASFLMWMHLNLLYEVSKFNWTQKQTVLTKWLHYENSILQLLTKSFVMYFYIMSSLCTFFCWIMYVHVKRVFVTDDVHEHIEWPLIHINIILTMPRRKSVLDT